MQGIASLFSKFFKSSQSSGILLILCVAISLLVANSALGDSFSSLLDFRVASFSISEWVNDGLMTIFFLLVGLEIKRELVEGELSDVKSASLPIFGAIGGMVVPALIFLSFNHGTEYSRGWGIPMATDIAFSLAIISLLAKNIPLSLKVFLAALAIIDDLGAILVIAIFYTEELHWMYLGMSLGAVLVLFLLNRLNVRRHIFYFIPGLALWYFIHHSGIHATISGVLLAFSIPIRRGEDQRSPLEKLETWLHTPVSYVIMPIFALANTNIRFKTGMVDELFTSLGYGLVGGLVLGKLIGINLFSFLAVKLKMSRLPEKSGWFHMLGVGFLAGIGFTMSIFIALLSFEDRNIQDDAKFAVLIASFISGISGYLLLKSISKKGSAPQLD